MFFSESERNKNAVVIYVNMKDNKKLWPPLHNFNRNLWLRCFSITGGCYIILCVYSTSTYTVKWSYLTITVTLKIILWKTLISILHFHWLLYALQGVENVKLGRNIMERFFLAKVEFWYFFGWWFLFGSIFFLVGFFIRNKIDDSETIKL